MAERDHSSGFAGRLPRSNARLLVIIAALILIEGALGYFAFRRYEADFLAERKSRLESIAILESARLSQWLAERLADASLLSRDTEFGSRVKAAMAQDAESQIEVVRQRLQLLRHAYGYREVAVAAPDGRVVVSTGKAAQLEPEERAAVRNALERDMAIASTAHRDGDLKHDMDIAAPVHAPGGKRLPAVVLLEIETDKLVAARTLERPDDTVETLLVRVAGGDVFYLNQARYPDALKRGRASGANGELVAAQAVRGARGVVTGIDYAGAPVFAAIVEVPRTDWLIITKVDAGELRGLIRYRATLVIAAFVIMLLLMTVAAYQMLRRREAAARLHGQEERARLAAIVEGADDAIVSSDLDRIITTWNPAAERLFGYTAAEALGRHIAMLLLPHADDDVETSLARVAEGETVKSADVVRIAKDGRRIDVSVKRSPIMDEDGRVTGVARIYRDIREQKRAAAAQERLAAIVEHSDDAMVTRSMDGIVTSWNAGAARMFGYSADEAIGRHVKFLHAPGNVPAIASANEQLRRGESVPPFRGERVTKDGRTIDVLTSLSPLRGANGEVEGASLIFQDMSQLRRAETALSESEQRLRAAFEQAAVGMGLRAADPDHPRWLRVNQKLCDILGYAEAELLQMTSLDVTPPDDLPASIENNRRLLDGRIPAYSRNKRYVRKDGSLIWVNISLSLVRNEAGTPLHVISVVEDITARKNTEMQLARWTSFYAALSETNEAIVRIGDRDKLFRRVCSIAAEKTGLLAAWIGLLDEDTGLVHPVATAGPASDYAADITVSIDPRSPAGHGPSGHAIRGNQPYIVPDVASHETADYWKQRAMRRGIRSSASFPLRRGGKPCGCLSLYAAEPGFFDDELVRLLAEMASDISFGMDNMDRETQRREAEERVRLSALAFANIADGVVITDADHCVVSVNKAYTVITGYTEEETLGREPPELHSDKQDAAFYQALWARVQHDGHWQGEIWSRRKNGDAYPEFLSVSALKDETGTTTHYVRVFNDISQFKAYEEHLEYLAHHDPLTDLPNRTLLEDRVEMAIANAERKRNHVALLFVDLDRFKLINDTLGHAIGDELLIGVAKRLGGCVRASDTVSRHGGDEFLVLLPEILHVDDAARIAENLMEEVSRPYTIGGHELATSVSIGISVYPENGEHMSDLLRNADAAMYAAKERGRNRFQFYTQSMNVRARERLSLEGELRMAIERDQLHLVYQPQLDLRSRKVVGLEALLRWTHPVRGEVPPAAFIPVAEDSGLIVKIGEWVLRTACAQNKRWRDAGVVHVPVAVNVSAIQFRRAHFARMVGAVLADTGLDASGLELELTESVVMEGPDVIGATLQALHEHGVRLTIDDFGKGYSSLSYLRYMPIQQLKIDQMFVRDLPENGDSAVLTQTIATMARGLDLSVVAEGVERAVQLDFLAATACDKVQGYLFCRPLPPAELEAWIAAHAAAHGTSPAVA